MGLRLKEIEILLHIVELTVTESNTILKFKFNMHVLELKGILVQT